ncbi:hypothetical protein Vadar_004784 [Vaccinium darrowii]|uniref:Uncharacterized protein n=1 Tax=Vaccinium darrowii TaxID=229202 RepID=A0ACB7Y6J0_9ERIC|nr:hypothetical protein Vadar_004784 [Vaccinium darrowii]
MVSSAELHVVVLAKLGLLLGLIQIMYQNRSDSPFETHPATMAISIAALCIYGIATALLKFKASKAVEAKEDQQQKNTGHYFLYYHRILEVLVLISSMVTPSCLVSVFVSDGLGWIVFVSCATIFSALVVAWNFLFLRIFRSANSSQCAAGPNRV